MQIKLAIITLVIVIAFLISFTVITLKIFGSKKKRMMRNDKKHWVGFILIAILVLLMGIGASIRNIDYSDKIKHLENEVAEAYDKGYLDGENHALSDLTEDYFDILIENAVLKERLNNQPSNERYIEQILDDFELLMELQQHYYQENITSHSFGDWLQINYPALYERILNYY